MNLRPLFAAMAALSLAQVGHSQEDVPAESARGSIEEIIVSARRKDESASTVPLSITAFGPEQLESRSITNQTDLRTATPGLLIRATNSSNDLNYVIRGQSLEAFSGSSPAVLPYFNNVQLSPGGSASLYDLESVQVLKGPQGTLFGRNTTGGAVLFATALPENEFGGNITVRAGNLSLWQTTGAVNLPIIEDKILLRVAGDLSDRDGYVKNLYNDKTLGDDTRDSGRITLQIMPTDTVENTLVYQYNHASGTNIPGQLYSVNMPGQLGRDGSPLTTSAASLYNQQALDGMIFPGAWNAFLAAHPGVPNMSFADYLAYDRANGKFKASTAETMKNGVVDHLVTNTTSIDLNDDMQLKAILGYGKSHLHQVNDYDGSPFPIATNSPYLPGTCPFSDPDDCVSGDDVDLTQKSFEVQVAGTADSLEYMVGVYLSRDEKDRQSATGFFDLSPFQNPVPILAAQTTTTTDAAIFTQMTVDMGSAVGWDGLSLTGGFRWAREKVEFEQMTNSMFYNQPGGENEQDDTVEKPSWVLSAEYQLTPDMMVYVAQRGSWRSAGFNGAAFPITAYAEEGGNLFKPETTVDVEAGVKMRGELGDMPLTSSFAVYNQWVEDSQKNGYYTIQTPQGQSLVAATANVPKAEISGFELETTILPLEWLEFGLNVSYTDARFTSNEVTLFGKVTEFGPYADAPDWSGTVYAQGKFFVGDIGELRVRADVFSQSSFYFANLGDSLTPGTELPGYSVVNLRAEMREIMGSGASVALFGKNVFDKGYYVGGLPEGAGFGSNYAIVAEPRTYGVELTYNF